MPAPWAIAENKAMAISSALSGMNAAAYQMLQTSNGIASGNLDDMASKMQNLQMAKIQFAASAKVAEVQGETTSAALDMIV